MQVAITADGRLQLTEDSMVFPPLTPAEVLALANAIPALQADPSAVPLDVALRDVAYALSLADRAPASATVVVQNLTVTVTTDDAATFATLAEIMVGPINPSVTLFIHGPVTVILTTGV